MNYSKLLTSILDNAERIRTQYGVKHLCAPVIVASVCEFRSHKYNGLSDEYYPVRFEEERLRYLHRKIIRLGGNLDSQYARMAVKHSHLDTPFDFTDCKKLANDLQRHALSADIVFLLALEQIPPEHRICLSPFKASLPIQALLGETDRNIYDYVIDNINEVCKALQAKAQAAAAIRDWRPANKFAESEALSALFFDAIDSCTSGNKLTIHIPNFFCDKSLVLSLHHYGDLYYIHDNGCAIDYLKTNVSDSDERNRILNAVCNEQWIVDGKITGFFSQTYHFFYYLQRLIFIAHADLHHMKAERQFYDPNNSHQYIDSQLGEAHDFAKLLQSLKENMCFGYDENAGLYFRIDTTYSLNSTTISFLIETLDDNTIRISDNRKGKIEGEIFESFYWSNDSLLPYRDFIETFTSRFGAYFDGENVYLIADQKDFISALLRFINLAVLLSELNRLIALPEA